MSDKFNLLPEGIRSAILCSRIFAINKPSIGRIEKEHILGLSSLLEITALQLQEARVRHVAPAAPELEGDDLTVWRITLPSGEQCHFGTESMARAWGRGEGKVERVDLKVRPRLEVVHTPSVAALAQQPAAIPPEMDVDAVPGMRAAEQPEKLLAQPAKVGAVHFHAGVPERLVIECAQRHYMYEQAPPFGDDQITGLAQALGSAKQPDAVKEVPRELLEELRRAIADYVEASRRPGLSTILKSKEERGAERRVWLAARALLAGAAE